jgi:hypothetical protein
MSKHEAREQRVQVWLDHLRRCEAAGRSAASYAKEQGLPAWALYQWRSRLVRDGLCQRRPVRRIAIHAARLFRCTLPASL